MFFNGEASSVSLWISDKYFCDHLKLAEETLSLSPKDLGTLGGVRAVWPVLSPVNEVSVAPL